MISRIRVLLKLFKSRVLGLPAAEFCKHCGRDVHGFVAPDDVWAKVEARIRFGHVLCYDCFCEVCIELGLPSVWRLEKLCG